MSNNLFMLQKQHVSDLKRIINAGKRSNSVFIFNLPVMPGVY